MFACRGFFGSAQFVVALTNSMSCAFDNVSPNDAHAGVRFNSDGTISVTQGSSVSWIYSGGTWGTPSGAGDGTTYWVRATITAGDPFTSGTTGSWIQISTAPLWRNAVTTIGNKNNTVTFEIASDSGGSNIIATITGVTIDTLVEP